MSATVESFVVRITRDESVAPDRPGMTQDDIATAMITAHITRIGWSVTHNAIADGLLTVEVSPMRIVHGDDA